MSSGAGTPKAESKPSSFDYQRKSIECKSNPYSCANSSKIFIYFFDHSSLMTGQDVQSMEEANASWATSLRVLCYSKAVQRVNKKPTQRQEG